ncbi:MAG: DUF4369 domain-containing protein [Bacteroidota bacterium]|nr:DUF4369 domain-containing protein [Bacteroidota bacterium]
MGKVNDGIGWFLLIVVTVVFVGCKRTPEAKSDEVVINGTLTNSKDKIIWLHDFDGKSMHLIDSAHVRSDKELFSFRIKVKDAGMFFVSSRNDDYALLIGNKGETIKLTGDADDLLSTWNAKGSKETRLYLDYWDVTRKQLKRIDSVTFVFRTSHMSPEYLTTRIRLDSIFNAIMENQRDFASHFINKNSGSLASLLVLDAKISRIPLFYEERDINYFKKIDSSLAVTHRGNQLTVNFHERVQQIMKRIKYHQKINHMLPPGDLNPSYSPNR